MRALTTVSDVCQHFNNETVLMYYQPYLKFLRWGFSNRTLSIDACTNQVKVLLFPVTLAAVIFLFMVNSKYQNNVIRLRFQLSTDSILVILIGIISPKRLTLLFFKRHTGIAILRSMHIWTSNARAIHTSANTSNHFVICLKLPIIRIWTY